MNTMSFKQVFCAGILGAALGGASVSYSQTFNWQSILAAFQNWMEQSTTWSVVIRQNAVVGDQVSNGDRISDQSLSAAMSAIKTRDRLGQVVTDYSAAFGQPVTTGCVAQQQGKLHVAAVEQRNLDTGKLMQSFANGRVASRVAARHEQWDQHRQTYCSVSEAKQGLCELSANGMQAWDTDYSGAFSERTLSPEGEMAGYAFAAMIADTRAPETIDCATTACHAARMRFLQTNSASSMVAHSFVGQVTDRRTPTLTGQ